MNDDDLTRRLRESNPARTPMHERPDEAALGMRDRIMGVPARTRPRAIPRVMWAAAAAIVVLAVAAVSFLVPQAPAAAVTPAPITFTDGKTMDEVVEMAQRKLSATGTPHEPTRFARSESWGLSVDVDEQRSEIIPQVMTLEWNPDLSGRMTVVAGEPYWPGGSDPSSDASAEPGDVLSQMDFRVGEFGTPVVDPPGAAREDMIAMLTAFGMPDDPTASDVIQAMTGVFEQWTLTNEQHARILSILVKAGGLTVLGTGTDRAGRSVVGLDAASIYPGVRDMVLISTETGRIVGVESKRVTPDGIVPAGAVISYRMWGTA